MGRWVARREWREHFGLCIAAQLGAVAVLGLSGCCKCPDAKVPAGQKLHTAPLAATECRVAERVLRALEHRKKPGNFVFSPHAITRALAALGELESSGEHSELLDLLGKNESLDSLVAKLETAERGFVDPLASFDKTSWLYEEHMQADAKQRLFDYVAAVGAWGFDQAPSTDPPRSGVLRPVAIDVDPGLSSIQRGKRVREWLNAATGGRLGMTDPGLEGAGIASAIDLRLGGVPSDHRKLRRAQFDFPGGSRDTDFVQFKSGPGLSCIGDNDLAWWTAADYWSDSNPPRWASGPAFVTFAVANGDRDLQGPLPLHQCSDLPFERGAKAHVDLSVPTFCAQSTVGLQELAPELGLPSRAGKTSTGARGTAPDVLLAARLDFDVRGTLNRPAHVDGSPRVVNAVHINHPEAEFKVEKPFIVTVHDPETGAIFYVAWIEEPGPC